MEINEVQVILARYFYSGFGLCPGCALVYILFEMCLKIQVCAHTHTHEIYIPYVSIY